MVAGAARPGASSFPGASHPGASHPGAFSSPDADRPGAHYLPPDRHPKPRSSEPYLPACKFPPRGSLLAGPLPAWRSILVCSPEERRPQPLPPVIVNGQVALRFPKERRLWPPFAHLMKIGRAS